LPQANDDLDNEFYSCAVPFVRRAVRENELQPPPDVEIFSFHYDLQTGAVRLNTPGFVHALRLMQRLETYRQPADGGEAPRHFQNGQAVLCLASPSWITRFQENAALRGKFGICRVPGSGRVFDYRSGQEQVLSGSNYVPYLGAKGWVTVVPRSTGHADAAFSLSAFLSSPSISRDLVIEPAWGGGVFRRDHLESRLGWQAFGLGPNQTDRFVESLRETIDHPLVKNPVVRLRIPDEHSHQLALVVELRAALLAGKDAQKALDAVAQQWQRLDAGKDSRMRLNDYRLSLSIGRMH
jgi:ABC-type glycerol-3-phosphate transport system substrate-binding protein